MNQIESDISTRQAAITGLAIVGFIGLVGAGIWLGVYSTRYVPSVVNQVGAAAVYLGSIFTPSTASLSVVPTPTASSTISHTASSTADTVATKEPILTEPKKVTPTAGEKTNSIVQISESPSGTGVLTGLPDLIVTINTIGYLATTSADSFVASSTVPTGSRPAVRFSIKNVGTNTSGVWHFSASIPTQSSFIYQSQPQQLLNPGDSIDYTLGFDQATTGTGKMISITANFDRTVTESNSNNNSASATITILGS